jgi:hypothetical protein
MSKNELEKMPMTLKHKSTGKIYKSGGKFVTLTCDWNCDGDVYTDTIMPIFELSGNGFARIHEYDFDEFEVINERRYHG